MGMRGEGVCYVTRVSYRCASGFWCQRCNRSALYFNVLERPPHPSASLHVLVVSCHKLHYNSCVLDFIHNVILWSDYEISLFPSLCIHEVYKKQDSCHCLLWRCPRGLKHQQCLVVNTAFRCKGTPHDIWRNVLKDLFVHSCRVSRVSGLQNNRPTGQKISGTLTEPRHWKHESTPHCPSEPLYFYLQTVQLHLTKTGLEIM